MEKLLNLLNEYEEKRIKKINADGKLRVKLLFKPYTKEALTNQAYQSVQNEIISKYYGFIKRLVEKDKIDRAKFGNSETKSSKYSDFELSYDTPREDYINILLMELSIQDEPINFLISVLK